MKDLAPIALFVYNRPEHTLKTLKSLKNNTLADMSILYIYLDKNKNSKDKQAVLKVKEIINEENWCRTVKIVEREENFGLYKNIVNGINDIVNSHNKVIVLEDDLLTSPTFLEYMNMGLNLYEKKRQVFAINGYMFPIQLENTALRKAGFLPLTSTWGWATWLDRWQLFEYDLCNKKHIENNKELKQRFNFGGYDYYKMLENKNSWGIKWYYTMFEYNGLCLFPYKSLIDNIGHDGSGVHCKNDDKREQIIINDTLINEFPNNEMIDFELFDHVNKYYKAELVGEIKHLRKWLEKLRKRLYLS